MRLRVVFFGCGGVFFEAPLRAIAKDHDIVGIVSSSPPSIGTTSPARNLLRELIWVIPGSRTSDYLIRRKGVPAFVATRSNQQLLCRQLIDLNPDLFCIASFSFLLKRQVLEIPRFGVLNVHPSLLPTYRGPNPYFWTYLNGDEETGVTIHWVDEGEDTGVIVFQKRLRVPFGFPGESLIRESATAGASLLRKAADEISKGRVPVGKPNTGEGVRAPRPKEGHEYVDWKHWSTKRVFHFLRGVWPAWHTPAALRELSGKQGWALHSFSEALHDKMAGTLWPHGTRFRLFTMDGWIEFKRQHPPFARRAVTAALRMVDSFGTRL